MERKYEKRVLIIDDNLVVCKEIKYALLNETTDVYYALSVHDGMELLKMLQLFKPIPILVLSSKPGSEERIAALKAGAHGYMERPYDLEECHAQALMQLYAQLHTGVSI